MHIVIRGNGIIELKYMHPLPQLKEGKEKSVGDMEEKIKGYVE